MHLRFLNAVATYAGIHRLTQRETQLLRIATWYDLSGEALAKELGMSRATVKTHTRKLLHRTHEKTLAKVKWTVWRMALAAD